MNEASPSRAAVPPREHIIAVFALLVQQNAYVSLPLLMKDVPYAEMREFENPLNTAAVALSLLFIGVICLFHLKELDRAARANTSSLFFTGLVVLSTVWSIHPDITIRRACGYVLTILIAVLLPLRFGVKGFMKVLSVSFAISAVGSLAFVLIAPQYGIMQEGDLAGCWQGVFCTKELFGSVMAVAVFVETYVLIECNGRQRWRYSLLALYVALVILSQSKTALLTVVGYSSGACIFLLWKRHRMLSIIGGMSIVFALVAAFLVITLEPTLAFSAVGKDPTLTGRTRLWSLVVELVEERPVLGWGYKAMWQSSDSVTTRIDDIVGFVVPNSHNAFLETALQLGGTGVVLLGVLIYVALRRGVQLFARGGDPLGWFCVLFVIGACLAALTTDTLGEYQVIEWVVFKALLFSCGMCRSEPQGSAPTNGLVVVLPATRSRAALPRTASYVV